MPWLRSVCTGLALVLCALAALAQTPQQTPLLYAAERDGQRVFVFGSIHLGVDGMYPLPATVLDAFDAADALALELVLDEIDAATMQRALATYAKLPPGQSLAGVMPDALWWRTQAAADALGLSVAELATSRPWYVATQLVLLKLAQSGFRMEQGVDQHLASRARRLGKRVLALENLYEQMNAFASMDPQTEQSYLALTLDELPDMQPYAARLLGAWWRGDAAAINELGNEQIRIAGGEALYQRLMVARNRRMVTRIMTAATRYPTLFVTVGVAHLVGEGDLISMLKDAGYRMTPLP